MAKQRESLLTHCLNCNHSLVSHFHTSDWGKVGACQKTRAEGSWRCTCPMFEPDRRSGQTITVTIKPDIERFTETLMKIGAEFNERIGKNKVCGRCQHSPSVHLTAPEEIGDRLNWCARCGSVEKVCIGYVPKSNLFPMPLPPRPACGKCEHPHAAHLRIWTDDTYEEEECHMIGLSLEDQARECPCEGYEPKKVEFQVEGRGF